MENFILVPAISGLVAQILNLLEALKADPARQPNFKDWIYWLPYLIGPILGGFAGYYSFHDNPNSFTTTLGVQVGISAPLLLRGLAATIPTPQRN
ncbi:hypothetical protein OCK74_12090 [Chitinophagaceae bacterium LB-8]|uniref:Uncharacterized protein n=1 Tax=Paraflavisolibacter caeni TaxID=2982496 RepID=A0A9X3BHL2_9BACT|nr:hypothetical protein [Paraflavisolibacter caeni]MCU7549862.1 hypothetical protein [Paraflavisolibacter caeni]